MAKETLTLIAIDIGSTNVRALAAQATPTGDIEIQTAGQAPALGVQRGIITNVDEASFAIRAALQNAGLDGKGRNTHVSATIGGKHIASLNHCREVNVSRSDGLIGEKDVQSAMEASGIAGIPEGAQVVHAIPRSYRVDGYLCRRNPIGMRGPTVGVESLIITAEASAVANVTRAVQMAGKELDSLVANCIASSHGVLTQDEKEKGAVLLDIGGGATHIAFFSHGAPVYVSALPVGGNQIINDLAVALNTPVHVAERLYLDEGSCSPTAPPTNDELTIRCFGPTGTRTLRRVFLNEVIRLRVEEILRMGYLRARASAPEMAATVQVVITGGVANLRGMEALAAHALQTSVRIGSPIESPAEPSELANPLFAASIGLVRLASDPTSGILGTARDGHQTGFRFLPQWVGLKARAV